MKLKKKVKDLFQPLWNHYGLPKTILVKNIVN